MDKKITDLVTATPEETDVIPFVDISDTTMGAGGTTKKATKADLKGEKGDNATVDAGTTTTGNAGTNASVVNSGTTQNAVFDFTIPRGDKGETGDAGACVESVAFVGNDMVFTLDDTSTVTLVGAKTDLKGDTGAQVESVAFVGDDMVFTLDDSTTVTLTGAKTSLKGDTGKGITSITKTNTVGLVDTYTITYSDSTTSTFDVTNGAKGDTGDIGIDWQGAWSAGTYTITQAVSHNGSSWICTATSTTEEPSISATDWDLIALKGTDGEGSGDVVGPASATADNIAVFDGITGKLIKDGGATIASKQDALGFTPENVANKVTSFQATPDNTHYPSEKLVKDSLDAKTSLTGTETLTNKRITPRVTTITSSATPTINTDNCDAVTITAQAEAITSMTTNLSGTPTNFQKLIIRIKDNGTARAITWGTSFESKGVALPTTTVISKVLTVGFIYDTVTSKWGCVAVAQQE